MIYANNYTLRALILSQIRHNGNYCNLNHIDVSRVTNMENLFIDSNFRGDISQWNTSNVTNMCRMFQSSLFNGDISKWNTSKVIDMSFMFDQSLFNGDISNWNVSNVTHMSFMFHRSEFNQNISKWDTSKVEAWAYFAARSKLSKENLGNLNVSSGTEFNNAVNHRNLSTLQLAVHLQDNTTIIESWVDIYEKYKPIAHGLNLTNGEAAMFLFDIITRELENTHKICSANMNNFI